MVASSKQVAGRQHSPGKSVHTWTDEKGTGSPFATGIDKSQKVQLWQWSAGSGSALKAAMLLDRIKGWVLGFIWESWETCCSHPT